MATAPTSLTIRMYNVGFGDCFLLSFQYAKSARHVLLDYGSTAAPKRGPKNYMQKIAEDIKTVSSSKLDGIIATHRHRDHVSGFATDAGTGKIIASLNPDFVIQPWTEDPKAKTNALTATASVFTHGKADPQKMTAHFLGSLEDMHAVAASIAARATSKTLAGAQTLQQLKFIGEDNIKNPSAVKNLIQMGKRGKAYYVNAGMSLNILPGVKCTVLGPPTLKQSNAIRKERARDPNEFWQFRSFWGSQSLAAYRNRVRKGVIRPAKAQSRKTPLPASVRWFVSQARQIQADQMLGLVRDLDTVMNNTSVILLLTIGKKKVLLPGDAQIENWAYALANPQWRAQLADVNLYKVGHHGSLNATPKSLWALFNKKGKAQTTGRLETLCSTKAGKHGSVTSGTEVPQHLLVDELKKDSAFTSTEETQDPFCHKTELVF
jgi:beta-lactamase superfamily II metal-dependent hydrolase